jgi:hypothetical protein
MQATREIKFQDLPYTTKKELIHVMAKQNLDFKTSLYGGYIETKVKLLSS